MNFINLAILTPTFNEAKNIDLLLRELSMISIQEHTVNFNVFVIDDSSPDGTSAVASSLASTLKHTNFLISVVNREKKEGLGKAYIDGFKSMLQLDNPPDFVLQMDADLSHSPKYIPQFIEAARGGADFVVGSRYIPGGSSPDWSWYRKLLSRGGNFYACSILGRRIHDYTGGFNMYSIGLIRKMDVDSIDYFGYGFLIDLKFRAARLAKKIVEVPIHFIDREYGHSKMPANTIINNFLLVPKIRFKSFIKP
jgi:dolichol-phosphate mannosyltransferase